MSDLNAWGWIGGIVGGIGTVGAAIVVLPKAAKAIINTARMAVAVNDAMPVVMQLPRMMSDAAVAAKEMQDHLKRQDTALAEVAKLAKNAVAVASRTKESTDAALSKIIQLTDGTLSKITEDLRDKNDIIAATNGAAIEKGRQAVEESKTEVLRGEEAAKVKAAIDGSPDRPEGYR